MDVHPKDSTENHILQENTHLLKYECNKQCLILIKTVILNFHTVIKTAEAGNVSEPRQTDKQQKRSPKGSFTKKTA